MRVICQRDVEPMLGWCWPIVYDAGPTSTQHWFNVSCSLVSTSFDLVFVRTTGVICQDPGLLKLAASTRPSTVTDMAGGAVSKGVTVWRLIHQPITHIEVRITRFGIHNTIVKSQGHVSDMHHPVRRRGVPVEKCVRFHGFLAVATGSDEDASFENEAGRHDSFVFHPHVFTAHFFQLGCELFLG